jgi:hypothetical protein
MAIIGPLGSNVTVILLSGGLLLLRVSEEAILCKRLCAQRVRAMKIHLHIQSVFPGSDTCCSPAEERQLLRIRLHVSEVANSRVSGRTSRSFPRNVPHSAAPQHQSSSGFSSLDFLAKWAPTDPLTTTRRCIISPYFQRLLFLMYFHQTTHGNHSQAGT